MGWMGNNLTRAREAAQANANYFQCTYYVVSTTRGLYVERERPADETLIAAECKPATQQEN